MQQTTKHPACALSARWIQERRAAFIARLAKLAIRAPEARAEWRERIRERPDVADALERRAIEERIARFQATAQNARAAGRPRRAHHYESEATYLLQRLVEVSHG